MPPKKNKPKIKWDEFEANYGWAKAVLTSNPELKRLAEDATKESWTQSKFVAALRGTKWYKRRTESERETFVLKRMDHSEYVRRVEQMKRHVINVYGDKTGGKGLDREWLQTAAKQAIKMGWTDEEIEYHAARATHFGELIRQDRLGGEAEQIEDMIRKASGDYGVKFSQDWVVNRVRNTMLGHDSPESIMNNIRKMAAAKYRGYAEEINQGLTMRDLAEPYIQSVSRLLEIPDGQVNLFNQDIQRALQYTGGEGKKGDPKSMPLWKFENQLRHDPRWDKTKNAQDGMMATAREVLKTFGVMA